VSTESARLRSIVNDLLWLARADGETPDDDAEESVDIGMAAEACVDRFGAIASANGLDLRYEPAGEGPAFVRSHPDSIDRLLGVLVDNACRYAGTGGAVTVGVAQSGSHVRLTVDDSGPGIPDKDQSLIFDRFHRATDAAGGTGLGLAIADTVVRRSNGEWSIGRSQLGGAKFEVKWKQVHAPPARRTSDNEDLDGSSGRSSDNMGHDQGLTASRPPERTTTS
jgi:signal transduction histidine kinase